MSAAEPPPPPPAACATRRVTRDVAATHTYLRLRLLPPLHPAAARGRGGGSPGDAAALMASLARCAAALHGASGSASLLAGARLLDYSPPSGVGTVAMDGGPATGRRVAAAVTLCGGGGGGSAQGDGPGGAQPPPGLQLLATARFLHTLAFDADALLGQLFGDEGGGDDAGLSF